MEHILGAIDSFISTTGELGKINPNEYNHLTSELTELKEEIDARIDEINALKHDKTCAIVYTDGFTNQDETNVYRCGGDGHSKAIYCKYCGKMLIEP